MPNLIGSLLTNANALNVHSLGVQTAGKNIANVNDPAYARQRMILREGGNLQSMGSHTQALGIEALGIEHIRNTVLDSQIMKEEMNNSSLEMQSDLLKQLEANINDIIDTADSLGSLDGHNTDGLDTGSLSAALDDFLNAFTELASDTQSEPLKEVVFQQAEMLIDQFHAMDSRLKEFDDFIALEMDAQVDEANDLLAHIANLNEKVASFEAREGSMAPEFRDERQEALERLAQIIDFTASVSSTSPAMIDITIRQASTTATATTTTTTDTSTGDIKLVSGGSVTGKLGYEEDEATFSKVNGTENPTLNTTFTTPTSLTGLDFEFKGVVLSDGTNTVTEFASLLSSTQYTVTSVPNSTNPILSHVDKIMYQQLGTASTEDKEVFLKGGSLEGAQNVKRLSLATLALDIDALANAVIDSVNNAYGSENTFFNDTTTADFSNVGGTSAPKIESTFTTPASLTGLNAVFGNSYLVTTDGNNTVVTDPTSLVVSTEYKVQNYVRASEIDFSSSLFSTITINGESVNALDPTKLITSSDTEHGGNDLALAIGALGSTQTMNTTATNGGYTFREFVALFSARVGAETETTELELESQGVINDYLREQRESHSGVSIDEEMTDLLRFQRAFQGTSRVINIVDNLLETIVTGLVR